MPPVTCVQHDGLLSSLQLYEYSWPPGCTDMSNKELSWKCWNFVLFSLYNRNKHLACWFKCSFSEEENSHFCLRNSSVEGEVIVAAFYDPVFSLKVCGTSTFRRSCSFHPLDIYELKWANLNREEKCLCKSDWHKEVRKWIWMAPAVNVFIVPAFHLTSGFLHVHLSLYKVTFTEQSSPPVRRRLNVWAYLHLVLENIWHMSTGHCCIKCIFHPLLGSGCEMVHFISHMSGFLIIQTPSHLPRRLS